MSKKVYILQKEYKRGSNLCWECEQKSYDYADILDKANKAKIKYPKDNYRIKTITE